MAPDQLLQVALVTLLVVGVSLPFWSVVGVIRVLRGSRSRLFGDRWVPGRSDVAVLVAAHDEEAVIAATLRSATHQVAPEQIFVASDGSTDRTAAIARRYGANVLELSPNRGKAGALAAAIEHFDLRRRFEVVMLLDADTRLADDYLVTGLPLFADPEVVAVAGTAASNRHPTPGGLLAQVLVAYRERVYVVFQYLQKFGQAARAADAVSIVPGFASMYRTRVLDAIDITAPGLAIEDFNMTFEVHAKQLGRIEFRPGAALAYTQDPVTLRDYRKQQGRWALGFWQTVRRHRFRATRFWAALTVSIAELVVGCVSFALVLPVIALAALAALADSSGVDPALTGPVAHAVPVPLLAAGALIPDYLLTVVAAMLARRPVLLVMGLVFPLLRALDAVICLRQLGIALTARSSGQWTSPPRRPVLELLEHEPLPVPARSAAR